VSSGRRQGDSCETRGMNTSSNASNGGASALRSIWVALLTAVMALAGVEHMRIAGGPEPGGRVRQVGQAVPVRAGVRPDMPGHAPWMGWHDDQHWVAESNQSGVFALFNPALAC
jgi:hypothetical protein